MGARAAANLALEPGSINDEGSVALWMEGETLPPLPVLLSSV